MVLFQLLEALSVVLKKFPAVFNALTVGKSLALVTPVMCALPVASTAIAKP